MNTQQPLISIIVPVYNGERFLRLCIESILGQTYRHWELILIDDGSTDASGVICESYKADPRVRVVHKPNQGHAAARNDGMNLATGQLIAFVDCDDWLDADMYERLVTTMLAEDADIVVCGFTEEYDGHQKVVSGDGTLTTYPGQEALKMVLRDTIGSYLWSMLFRREMITDPMPSLMAYEDHATIFKWFAHARRVTLLNRALYHYRQLEGSSLHGYNPVNGNNFFLAIKERYHFVANHNLLPGWEAENRCLYLRGCIKLTKDLARMPVYDEAIKALIVEVRDELNTLKPVSRHEVGTKCYIRFRLLLADIDLYVRVLRFTSHFSFSRRHKNQSMFR